MNSLEVQTIAKDTINYITEILHPGMKLTQVKELCEEYMLSKGITSFWYYNIGAFLFLGEDTTVSISGRDYKVSDKIISDTDILTIDLSPQFENIWGDYSRTILIENGLIVKSISDIKNPEWKKGLEMQELLH